jgi:hypothetical protein
LFSAIEEYDEQNLQDLLDYIPGVLAGVAPDSDEWHNLVELEQATLVELEERRAFGELDEEEERRRERVAELSTRPVELLDRRVEERIEELADRTLGAGGIVSQVVISRTNAVANFENYSTLSSDTLDFGDILGLALSVVPFAGPIARWMGNDNFRKAFDGLARAGMSEVVETATGEAETREIDFAARARADTHRLASDMNDDISTVLAAYRAARTNAAVADNRVALAEMLATLDELVTELRPIPTNHDDSDWQQLDQRLELELYRRYYLPSGGTARVRILYPRTPIGIPSRPRVRGEMTQDVQDRIERLAGRPILDVLREWHAPTGVAGGRYGEGYREVGAAMQ